VLIMSSLALWGPSLLNYACFGSFRDGVPASCLNWHMGKYCSSQSAEYNTSFYLVLGFRAPEFHLLLHLCWSREGQEAP